MSFVEAGVVSFVEASDVSFVEVGDVSFVETGDVSFAEAGDVSFVQAPKNECDQRHLRGQPAAKVAQLRWNEVYNIIRPIPKLLRYSNIMTQLA